MNNSTVHSVWRYPVKSMAGETLEQAEVTERGVTGDRAYALVDTVNGRVGSAKNVRRFGDLLKYRAEFAASYEGGGNTPAVRISFPDGRVIQSGEPEAEALLASAFGADISLVSAAPEGLTLEFAAGTLGGKYADTTVVPVAGAAPQGTLWDYATIHIVTTSSIRALEAGLPGGKVAVERFRPNLVVECPADAGFVENTWCGRTLAIGAEVRVKVSIPCPRCVMATLPRADLPLEPAVLRTIAQHNLLDLGDFGELPCLGVYADVVTPGVVRRNDPVRFVD